ncbi:hypothetical protein AAHA92_26762 [Salvia divinorum]|uniref:Uncharacterized protein n=1 Tax=Salvia divinorum TaxID=28513 RepID=A0ABD1G4A8_SALDI
MWHAVIDNERTRDVNKTALDREIEEALENARKEVQDVELGRYISYRTRHSPGQSGFYSKKLLEHRDGSKTTLFSNCIQYLQVGMQHYLVRILIFIALQN